jgi:putative chitinase
MTAEQFAIALGIPLARAEAWIAPLAAAMERFEISTPGRQAAFLAQIGWESAKLTKLSEDLNYSAQWLRQFFPLHFTEEQAQQYAHKPEAIANRAYAGRYGNGDEASGDGWLFRGAGLIQLTFRDNQMACAQHFGIAESAIGNWLRTAHGAALAAAWYWWHHGCNDLADHGQFAEITKRINGGLNGLIGRMNLWASAKKTLGV